MKSVLVIDGKNNNENVMFTGNNNNNDGMFIGRVCLSLMVRTMMENGKVIKKQWRWKTRKTNTRPAREGSEDETFEHL